MQLARKGADLSVRDNLGNTALALAAKAGHWNVGCLLLAQGANINDYYYLPRAFSSWRNKLVAEPI